jgi:hypothetical protein
MKLKLSVVNSTGSNWADVTEHGTLKSQLAKTDVLFLSSKNIESDSRVTIFVKETEDEPPKMISCSARLSKMVRKALAKGAKHIDILRALLTLRVIENDNGFFIAPEGIAGETFTADALAKGKVVTLETLANGNPAVLETASL